VWAALARERTWRMGRRPVLLVKEGSGEMFHVTATENRQSILRHGLDWRQMGTTAGIAGSREPELPAVFLCENRDEIGFFTQMSRLPAVALIILRPGNQNQGRTKQVTSPQTTGSTATPSLTRLSRDLSAGLVKPGIRNLAGS
jgi:hypothetical protein